MQNIILLLHKKLNSFLLVARVSECKSKLIYIPSIKMIQNTSSELLLIQLNIGGLYDT